MAAKLAPKFHGLFYIGHVLSLVIYEFVDLDGSVVGKVHINDLNPIIFLITVKLLIYHCHCIMNRER